MWGKLHQFANELIAPIEEEEEEEENDHHHHQQQQPVLAVSHKPHTTGSNSTNTPQPKEDSFFAQPFLSSHPQQQQQHYQPHGTNYQQSPQLPSKVFPNQPTMMNNTPYKPTATTTASSSVHSYTTNTTTTSSRLSPVSSVSSSSLPSSFFQTPNYHQQHYSIGSSTDLKRVSSSSSLDSGRSITPTLITMNQIQPQQQQGMSVKSSSSRSTTPTLLTHPSGALVTNQLPEMPPGLLVDGMTKPYNETTRTDNKKYIHVKLFVGDEVLNHEKYVEYLQSHIRFYKEKL
ncbi:hypothetical protein C9374_007622 [Naegleria lovaniensis]|uniref:Uncharacterized protein n=1 Tax=Naegleria lovaniensis TaxID=51637 RepID=A0AA88GGI3_NAELO|nr:uncharacterized protein C9374_007622 [Naegleria lovaniensis]KAG2378984.1 hypothetical protein C9374_007622 [Naegleria lovaniensis]